MTESEGETARVRRVLLSDGSFCWAKMSLAGIPRGMIRGIESQPCRDPSVRDYMVKGKGRGLFGSSPFGEGGRRVLPEFTAEASGFFGRRSYDRRSPFDPRGRPSLSASGNARFWVPRVSMNRHRQGAGHGRDPEHSGDHQKSFREDDPRTRPWRRGTLPTFHFPEEEFPS